MTASSAALAAAAAALRVIRPASRARRRRSRLATNQGLTLISYSAHLLVVLSLKPHLKPQKNMLAE